VREGHPLLEGPLDVERFAACEHISVSRRGLAKGPIDQALAELGLSRKVVMIAPSFFSAVLAMLDSDLILPMPDPVVATCQRLGLPLRAFEIPLPLATVRVRQSWHPRFDSDPAHRWLRQLIKRCCEDGLPG